MEKSDRVRTRITLRKHVRDYLVATAKVIDLTKNELADRILSDWLKNNVSISVGGEVAKLGERPNVRIDRDNVEIVKAQIRGGEKP